MQALTQFPSVLNTLASNITWTSALGDASATQQEATLAAVQRMRAKAYAAGNLKTGKEIKVVQESPQVIVIQPAIRRSFMFRLTTRPSCTARPLQLPVTVPDA